MEADNMVSHNFLKRPEPERSATWPSPKMQSARSGATSTESQDFEDDLEQHPDKHFLSPLTAEEVYGWDSDSDDDDADGEWNAGITDFSLFASDRKRAMETGQPLDEKWDSFVSNQTEAFERSCDRVWESENDRVPGLTPDTSPHLKDDLEDDAEMDDKLVVPWISVPDYLTFEVKPSESGAMLGPDDELPLSFALARKKRIERPGLRHARTMSGRKHVWRRPGYDMFTVGEEVDAEAEAERKESESKLLIDDESLYMEAE